MRALTSPEFVWVVQALLAMLALGLVLSLTVGAMLLAWPRRLFALNARVSRWIDTDAPLRALERPRHLERFFYRHHRLLGLAITLGAAYVLARWALAYDRAALIAAFAPNRRETLEWLVLGLEASLVVLHGLILAAGLVILVRPSLLKRVEAAANRWHAGPRLEALDAVIGPLDKGIQVYPRLSGLVMVTAAGWSLAALLPVLLAVLAR